MRLAAAVGRAWKRHASWLAALFAYIAVVLGAIVVVQALALHAKGWKPALGTVPEAVAAIGTVGALFVAIGVWRHEVAMRRADEAALRATQNATERAERAARGDQARLVVLEFQYDNKLDESTFGQYSYMHAVVANLSNRPIFDVHVDVPAENPQLVQGTFNDDPDNTSRVRAIPSGGKHMTSYAHIAPAIDYEWLDTVPVLHFTDANGVRWTRTSTGQPVELSST